MIMENNVHPIFREALAPFAPPPADVEVQQMRGFRAVVALDGRRISMNLIAKNSKDASEKAVEIVGFDGGIPDGASLYVSVRPMGR